MRKDLPSRSRAAVSGPAGARDLAVRALTLMDDGMPVQAAVDSVLAASSLASRERRLAAELVYGCARERIRCEAILGRLMRKPGGLPRPMLHCLAIAVHSLLFQSRIPAHAAISEAVRQVDRLYGQRLGRVANGVLRSLQRLGEAPLAASWYEDPGVQPGLRGWRAACRFWSLPDSIADLWRDAYGEEAALALMRRSFERPWTGVRINAQHPEARAMRAALEAAVPRANRADISPWGMAFAPGALPEELLGQPLARWRERGVADFQSAGSQAVLHELGLTQWRKPVWDACAGVGGKSLALLEAGVPVRLATDMSATRLGLLASTLARRALPQVAVALADAARPPMRSWPGHILVDAPCSGLGVLARRPDIRFPGRRDAAAMRSYPKTQQRIIAALAERLAQGCELAYLTCTLNPAENEAVVESLLARERGLELVRTWTTPVTPPWLEGMFGAVLRRR
ncbi:RsmB/NOP family class I SAM-dependent RNA methyltransferase [Desulfovibrio sp.]|uniref:RsmB/NOP family class I SAM-dependent RNA methyltransferase n=1 Tax=Desulfovibrio sp. TaxID=885 RepID=UPI0023C57080|nr:RsmB/NOP family class I SAM-dependent RNA methyltransferase [Desulfovibrio sp.]MDE7241551.1 RsmB/NOP family class I SAM-dependent RNA methyltransferase [Desulfovibrio sp.]